MSARGPVVDHDLEVKLVIPSRFKTELIAQATLRQLAQLGGYREEDIEEMELALGEACINAIEASRIGVIYVEMRYRPVENVLSIVVQDYGMGAQAAALPAPELEEKLKSVCRRGWGILIIERMMDEVTLSEMQPSGTKVEMKKYKAASADPAA